MDALHLGKGSEQPPKVEGKLRLYNMKFCPYAHRVWLVLEAKKLAYDVVNVNLFEKPEWIFVLHPQGKVPALDTGTEVVIESLDISDYLDEKYPDIPLYPAEPAAKQNDKELIKKIAPLTQIFIDLIIKTNQTIKEKRDGIWPQLEAFEKELGQRGTKYFSGDERPGMVDYMLWPFAQRAKVIKIVLNEDLLSKEDLSKIPLLRAWTKNMATDAAVKATYTTPEQFHKSILIKFGKLEPDYDII